MHMTSTYNMIETEKKSKPAKAKQLEIILGAGIDELFHGMNLQLPEETASANNEARSLAGRLCSVPIYEFLLSMIRTGT